MWWTIAARIASSGSARARSGSAIGGQVRQGQRDRPVHQGAPAQVDRGRAPLGHRPARGEGEQHRRALQSGTQVGHVGGPTEALALVGAALALHDDHQHRDWAADAGGGTALQDDDGVGAQFRRCGGGRVPRVAPGPGELRQRHLGGTLRQTGGQDRKVADEVEGKFMLQRRQGGKIRGIRGKVVMGKDLNCLASGLFLGGADVIVGLCFSCEFVASVACFPWGEGDELRGEKSAPVSCRPAAACRSVPLSLLW